MAIAFASVSIHSRSKGLSAVAGAAYRSGTALHDERTGETHNYKNRDDIAYSQIMLPEGADEKFLDREYLWNKVEAAETRRDAQVAKDIILALPTELDLSQHIALTRQFADYHFVSHGLAADIAIHHDEGNPHAHIYITTRRLSGDRFDRYKARDLNPNFANRQGNKGFIAEKDYWGEQWGEFQTTYFHKHNLDITVDATNIIPLRHEGRIREATHYLKEENALRRQANIEIALETPENILNRLSFQFSIFSEGDIRKLLRKNTANEADFEKALHAVLSHPELIELEHNHRQQPQYTTRANYIREADLADNTEHLLRQPDKLVSLLAIKSLAEQFSLNDEQTNALRHIAASGKIAAVVGRAGTGKSYLMSAVNELYTGSKRRIFGMAFSGVAAKNLTAKSGIQAHTIAYYQTLLQHNKWRLHRNDVVIIDEAGMVNLNDMADIVQAVKQANAKLILVGDPDQLQPIGKGAFRAILERIGFAEMSAIQRQQDAQDRQATQSLAKGDVKAALTHYEQKGQLHFLENEQQTFEKIVEDWQREISKTNIDKRLIMTFQNKHIATLNQHARTALQQKQLLSDDKLSLTTRHGEIKLAVGERILFLRNDYTQNIRNGEFATIVDIKETKLTVRKDNQSFIIDTEQYRDISYGYAATVHKAQGADFDKTFVYVAGFYWDKFLSYVALSRHKDRVDIYADKEHYGNMGLLAERMGKHTLRDNIIDYPISYALRRGFDPDSLIGKAIDKIASTTEKIHDKWLFITNHEAYLLKQHHKRLIEERLQQQQSKVAQPQVPIPTLDKNKSREKEKSRNKFLDRTLD